MQFSNKALLLLNLALIALVSGSFYVVLDAEKAKWVTDRFSPTHITYAGPMVPVVPKEQPLTQAVTQNKILNTEGLRKYFEVTDSCNHNYEGDCLIVRSKPSKEGGVVTKLRNGMILEVGETIENEEGVWHQVVFNEWLRYPERARGEWYVSDKFVEVFYDEGLVILIEENKPKNRNKTITVDKSEQRLYAHEGNELVLEIDISTGLEYTPTPSGTFKIFRKTPSRYMQGPLPYLSAQDYYDLPGVPWNMYFTEMGAVIHGAYWHESFGSQYSHGCVNVSLDTAEELYKWADIGTTVIVKN